MTERDRQRGDGVVVMHEAVELRALVARLLHACRRPRRSSAGRIFRWSRARPTFSIAALHVGVERAPDREARLRGEHRLRGLGRELAPGLGRAGLHDDRPALDRPRDVERTAHRQKLALVVEHMQLVGIEKDAVLDVADEGVIRPAVPQSGHHVVELARAAIALAVLHVLVEPEIQRRVRIGGGDDVPAGAAAADVIERRKPARDVIGRIEGGRAGGDQTDMLGRSRQRRQQRERLERGRRCGCA